MSDAANPFEQMMQQARDMAKSMNPALDTFSPEGFEALWGKMPRDVMEMTFGKGLNPNGLDAKTRLLLTLAGLTMQGAQAETALRTTVHHAREAGATDAEVAETIAQMAIFAGVPAMSRAMDLARKAMDGQTEEGSET